MNGNLKIAIVFFGVLIAFGIFMTWWASERDKNSHYEIVTITGIVTVDKYTECVITVNNVKQYTDFSPCLFQVGDKLKIQVYSKDPLDWGARGVVRELPNP